MELQKCPKCGQEYFAKKISPCLLPYNQLPENQTLKDELFLALARILAAFEWTIGASLWIGTETLVQDGGVGSL